jgi:hypothetical protein
VSCIRMRFSGCFGLISDDAFIFLSRQTGICLEPLPTWIGVFLFPRIGIFNLLIKKREPTWQLKNPYY